MGRLRVKKKKWVGPNIIHKAIHLKDEFVDTQESLGYTYSCRLCADAVLQEFQDDLNYAGYMSDEDIADPTFETKAKECTSFIEDRILLERKGYMDSFPKRTSKVNMDPLYLLRNSSSRTILCFQPLEVLTENPDESVTSDI